MGSPLLQLDAKQEEILVQGKTLLHVVSLLQRTIPA